MKLKAQFKESKQNFYQLDYRKVKQVMEGLGIKISLIDWEDSDQMRGKRRLYKGRIFISLTKKQPFQMIIIDKNHETRFLVEKIQSQRQADQLFSYPFVFYGIKIQSNKYFMRGRIEAFQMTSIQIHIGYDIIDKSSEQFQHFLNANVAQLQERKVILFCKDNNQNIKTYFDKQSNILKRIKQVSEGIDEHQYFGTLLSSQQLYPLLQNSAISTRIVSHFFRRLVFSHISAKWFDKNHSNIVAFSSQDLTSYFACQSSILKQSFFDELIVSNYLLINQNPFKQLKMCLFPIYEHNQYHFVLSALEMNVKQNRINIYELDPLDCKVGAWRNKLKVLLQGMESAYEGKQCGIFLSKVQKYLYSYLQQLKFPKQMGSNDCGVYIFIYAILLLQKLREIEIHQSAQTIIYQMKEQCKFFGFLRHFIYEAYVKKDIYLNDCFNHNFQKQYRKYLSSSKI